MKLAAPLLLAPSCKPAIVRDGEPVPVAVLPTLLTRLELMVVVPSTAPAVAEPT